MKKNIVVPMIIMVFTLSAFSLAEDMLKTQLRTNSRLETCGIQQSATCLTTPCARLCDGSGATSAPGKKTGRGR